MAKPNTIYRSEHSKQSPYKAISRAAMEDERLSYEAAGVLSYLLVKPDDWVVQVGDLTRRAGCGRDKAYRILNELMEAGYLERIEHRDGGRFQGFSYIIHESPCTDFQETAPGVNVAQQADSPESTKPYPAEPYPVFQEHTNKEGVVSKKTALKKKEQLAADAAQPAVATPQQEFFAVVCEACGYDPKTLTKREQGEVGTTASVLIKADYTVSDVRQWLMEIWPKGWQCKNGFQFPTPSQIRSGIGQLRSVVPQSVPVNGNGRPAPQSKMDITMENGRKVAERMKHHGNNGHPSKALLGISQRPAHQ